MTRYTPARQCRAADTATATTGTPGCQREPSPDTPNRAPKAPGVQSSSMHQIQEGFSTVKTTSKQSVKPLCTMCVQNTKCSQQPTWLCPHRDTRIIVCDRIKNYRIVMKKICMTENTRDLADKEFKVFCVK